MQTTKVTTVVLAAGASERIHNKVIPKQLLKVNGKPIVCHCLDIFQCMTEVDEIVLVIIENHRKRFETLVREGGYDKVRKIVSGGEYRQDSIRNALEAIDSCDIVIIQNAASILTPRRFVSECINKVQIYGAVSAFVPEVYSSFLFREGKVTEGVDRNTLGHVRAPQVFTYNLIREAYNRMDAHRDVFTNDVLLLRAQGISVYLVESPPENIKITTDVDIDLASLLLTRANCEIL